MKRIGIFLVVAMISGGFILTSCNKDNDVQPDPTDVEVGDLDTEIPVDSGSIGLVFNTRQVAKKGYQPHEIKINFSGDYAKFSEDISVDPTTHTGILRIDQDDLTAEEKDGFANGVPVS
jgi:hypothetical protein